MMNKNRRKLYLIGIDSAPLWVIERLCKSRTYNMDGFRLFMKNGLLTNIESTIPPVTSTAWPTIYTGLDPKDHGLIDFSVIDRNYAKELLYYDAEKSPPFWDVLASKGFSSLVVTPAVALQKSTYRNVDMLTGWPLQPRFSSKLIGEISKRLEYDGEPDIGNAINTGKLSLDDASKTYAESARKRVELSKYLIERNDYDMSFICFTETDRIQHYSLNLKDWDAYVAPLYEEISDFIDYINTRINELDENAVIMVVSDHGAQPIRHKFLSNSWFINKGYAALRNEAYGRHILKGRDGAMSKVKKGIVDRVVESRLRRTIYSRLPKSLKKVGEKLVEDSFEYEHRGRYIRITESDFDMKKTKAFCSISTGTVGMVLINDSRFSNPGIADSKREALKDELIKNLKEIRDQDGRMLMKNVYDGTGFFPKMRGIISPDIIFEVRDGYTADYSGYSSHRLYFEPEINRRGEHTRMGVFGIMPYNQNVNLSAIKRKELRLSNISPTILRYFGVRPITKSRALIL